VPNEALDSIMIGIPKVNYS